MNMPDYENPRIPEGAYTFTIKDVEKRKKTSQYSGKEFVTVTMKMEAKSDRGEFFKHTESLLPWTDLYRDLLISIGGVPDGKNRVSGQEVQPEGKSFRATIVYEEDENDSSKTWPRLRNIEPNGGPKAAPADDDDSDIPF